MSKEISLSLEETNKLRVQLGLKPIIQEEETYTKHEDDNKIKIEREDESPKDYDNEINFINKDKISLLRSKLSKMNAKLASRQQTKTVKENDTNYDNDWLNQIDNKKHNINKIKLTRYMDEEDVDGDGDDDDLPILQVSHDIKTIPKGKSTILTLKETSLHNKGMRGADDDSENDDILEDEDQVMEEETSKNLKLKQMNKERRRKKMTLQISSNDIDEVESKVVSKPVPNTIIVGGEIQAKENLEKLASEEQSKKILEGKVRVVFESDNDDDGEGSTDFKPVKIKKRKRKGDNKDATDRSRKRIKIPTRMHTVNLNDEEATDDDDESEYNDMLKVIPERRNARDNEKREAAAGEDIALMIRKENIERQERTKNLDKVGVIHTKTLTIDETSTFFDSLNTNILRNNSIPKVDERTLAVSVTQEVNNNNNNNNEQEQVGASKEEEEERPHIDDTPKPKIDFYNGLASTLDFLKGNNLLPKKEELSSSNGNRVVPQDGHEKNEVDNLDNYNPEIKLEYKDSHGNKLTTKEAYKKLSQKFHGTKSNKKKQIKFDQRIIDRNRLTNPKE